MESMDAETRAEIVHQVKAIENSFKMPPEAGTPSSAEMYFGTESENGADLFSAKNTSSDGMAIPETIAALELIADLAKSGNLSNEAMSELSLLINEVICDIDAILKNTLTSTNQSLTETTENGLIVGEGSNRNPAITAAYPLAQTEYGGTGEAVDGYAGILRGDTYSLPNVTETSIQYIKRDPTVLKDLRRTFDNGGRSDFIRNLAQDESLLRNAGFNSSDIQMIKDGYVPSGWQVHHKLPLDDSGTNNFDNLVLIQNEPYHKVITNHQNTVTRGMIPGEIREIIWPKIDGNIYP